MGLKQNVGFLALFVATVLSISCTRAPEKAANIQLVLPSNLQGKALAVLNPGDPYPQHIVINVTGAGMKDVVFAWDSDDGKNPLPDSFALTVTAGADRLVQVLAIYGYYQQGGARFLYGDTNVPVQNDRDVDVVVNAIGGVMTESQIMGRWVDNADNYGPTTKIIMKYSPPAGKRVMTIHTSEMFGGLFNVFALQGGVFDYVTSEGLSLFGGPTGIDSFATFSNHLVKVSVPPHYNERHDDSGGSPTYESTPISHAILGWFGPNAAGHNLCYPSAVGPMRGAYTSADNTSPLAWSTGFVVQGTGSGTSLDADNLCTFAGVRYADYLSVDGYSLGGHEDALGVRGPYISAAGSGSGNYGQVLTASLAGNSLTLNWKYAPNVITKATYASTRRGIDGSDAYYRVVANATDASDRDYKEVGGDGLACGHLPAGFNLITNKAAVEGSPSESPTVTMPATFSAAFNQGRVQIVLCPYQNAPLGKRYFSSGVDFRSYNTASNMLPAAEKLVISSTVTAANLKWADDTCVPFLLKAQTNGNLPAMLPPSAGISLTGTSTGTVTFYTDIYCAAAWPNNPQMVDQSSYLVYIRNSASGTNTAVVTASATGASSGPVNLSFEDEIIGGTEELRIITPSAIKAHVCYPIRAVAMRNSSSNQVLPFASAETFTFPTDPDIEYYYDGNCSSPWPSAYSSFNPTYTMPTTPTFFKYVGGPAANVSVKPTGGAFAGTIVGGDSMTATVPGAPTVLRVDAPQNMIVGQCYPVRVSVQDNQGNVSPWPAAITGSLATSGFAGAFTSGGGSCTSCSSGAAALNINIPLGQTSVSSCFKVFTAGTGAFTPSTTPSVPTNAVSASAPIPYPTTFVIAAPGQTFTDGQYSETGTASLSVGVPATFTIYAVYADPYGYKHIATNFNAAGGAAIPTAGQINLPNIPASVTFANGIGTMIATPAISGSTQFGLNQAAPPLSGTFSGGTP